MLVVNILMVALKMSYLEVLDFFQEKECFVSMIDGTPRDSGSYGTLLSYSKVIESVPEAVEKFGIDILEKSATIFISWEHSPIDVLLGKEIQRQLKKLKL